MHISVLHLVIDPAHSQIPPRGPASFIQLVCHKPVSCYASSVTQHHSISTSSLGIRLVLCADLVQATSYPKASCLQRIQFRRKPPVRHAFYPLCRAVVVAVYFTVKMSRGVMGCCPAVAS